MKRNIYSYLIRARSGWGRGIGPKPTHCAQCGAALPVQSLADTGATGYAGRNEQRVDNAPGIAIDLKSGEHIARQEVICYTCCADEDKRAMCESGRAVLYLVDSQASTGRAFTVQNWPGSLNFPVLRWSKRGGRIDVWFTGPDGAVWHGVHVGDNQILRCKRVKGLS